MRTFKILSLLTTSLLANSIGATPLSFEEALNRLQNRDTELQTQRLILKRTEAEQLNNVAGFAPSLSAQASDTQFEEPGSRRTQQGLLVGKLNLFRSFGDVAAWQSGRAAIHREQFALQQTELEREQANVSLLIDLIRAEMKLRVATTISRLSDELAEIEAARFKRGLVALQESQKAIVEKSNANARLQDATSEYKNAQAALNAQLGEEQTVTAQWPWKSLLRTGDVERFMNQKWALQNSPSYRTAQEAVIREDLERRARVRDLLPTVDLTVGYGYQDYRASKDTGWQTTLLLTIPLMDLRQHAQYRVQAEQEALARVHVEKTRRSLTASWNSIRDRLVIAVKSAQEREASRLVAQSLYSDNQKRLRAGRSNMNDIVVDQNRLSEAELLAVSGWAEAHLLYSEMCHLLGQRVNPTQFGCR